MGKGSKQEAPGRTSSGGVSNQLVKEVAARIKQYGQNNDYTDIDEVGVHLRNTNPAYKRRPQAQFRKVVERAVQTVQREGGPVKPELRLQSFEDDHIARQGRSEEKGSKFTAPSGRESDSGGDTSEAELDEQEVVDGLQGHVAGVPGPVYGAEGAANGMNSTLTTLYSTPNPADPANSLQPSPSGRGGPPDSLERKASLGIPSYTSLEPVGSLAGQQPSGSDLPAFAPAHLVAAAASRALAVEKAARNVSTPPANAVTAGQTAGSGRDVAKSTPGPAPSSQPGPPVATPGQRLKVRQQQTADRTTGKRPRTSSDARMSSSISQPQAVRYADLGGIEGVLNDILELVEWPLMHPEIYSWLGVEPPRGVLLHGPPGCGKTALANAIANECEVPFLRISAPEIVSGMSGESEAKLRQLFQEAAASAPCIIFIDEIDAIAGKRESAQREMERRIVAQMLTCMDDLAAPRPAKVAKGGEGASPSAVNADRHVLVIGATNRPDSLDTALRRAGRFDREIAMGIPNQEARARILQVIVQKLRLSGDFDFAAVAARTPGFVGADLQALTKEAAAVAVSRIFSSLHASTRSGTDGMQVFPGKQLGREPLSADDLAGLAITMEDFQAAIGKVQPSVRREGFATTPDVTWDDVGALREVREELAFSITQPIRHPQQFAAMGLSSPSGVLLFGPPGCGKTLLAKAVANDSGANFISIKGPELLNKFVGESERAVRQVFARARAASPCVLFFDEMDALAPRRGSDSNQSSERVVNQLLTEMDGIDGRQGVYMIAATNRPDIIDRALLRPGRLDKMLYIPLPTSEERAEIAAALIRSKPLAEGVDIRGIARDHCQGFSGADLSALVREAATNAIKASMSFAEGPSTFVSPKIEACHFQAALQRIKPSVRPKDQRIYDALRSRLPSARAQLERPQPAQSDVTHQMDAKDADALEGPTEMERSEGEVTAGNEPMDE